MKTGQTTILVTVYSIPYLTLLNRVFLRATWRKWWKSKNTGRIMMTKSSKHLVIPIDTLWSSCNHGTADWSSEGSGYCIANARSEARTGCYAVWCECFHHRTSCPFFERNRKSCWSTAIGTSARNVATSRQGWLFVFPTCVIATLLPLKLLVIR